ncbi:MAG: hypothetical protein B7Y93_01165 [Micrococcales bacterium 32-70-13]|nr:MAG: hypothetical protein B7Y93_01165 [Micrococcales bacterium 32-70-13]
MNTTLSTTRPGRQQQHPPSPTLETRAPARRVGLIDRLALRLGVALVAWSRRPRLLDDRDERARRVQAAQAAERRERSMQRDALLTLPPR